MNKIFLILVCFVIILVLESCNKTSNPTSPESNDPNTIVFSNLFWHIKSSDVYEGPGNNLFSGSNVWKDSEGKLHLRITKGNDGKWYCSEIYSDSNFSYGTYRFYIESSNLGPLSLNENVVFGMFTWDDNSFYNMANTEIDIEFAKWGWSGAVSNPLNTLQYSVQPTNGGKNTERLYRPASLPNLGNYSTHIFNWTPQKISFYSYAGYDITNPKTLTATWAFDDSESARFKDEGGKCSMPIVIPEPTQTTKVRINLYLFDANGDGIGDPPGDNKEIEVVISKFEFIPYNSTSNNSSWQNISQGFNSDDNISGMTVDENNNLWINLYNKGVYLSTDGGNSFQMKLSGNGYNNMLTYGQSIVWAQGDFTISKSNDEGSNWTKLPVGSWPDKNAICNYGSDLLYTVAWEGAAWKSIDGGNAWTQIIAPSGKEDYWGVGAANDNVAFIGGNLKDGTSIIYKTIDGGQTWNRAYTGENNGGIRLLVESPSLVYGVGSNGLIIKTTDGGTTWNKLKSSTNETLLNIKQVPNSSIYVTGTNGTILRSDDGVNWVKETSGTTVNLEGFAVSKTCIYASGMGTLLKKVIQ